MDLTICVLLGLVTIYHYPNTISAVSGLCLTSLVVVLGYFPDIPDLGKIAIYAILAAVVPYRMAVLMNHTKDDSTALKWIFFYYMAVITASFAAIAFFVFIASLNFIQPIWTQMFGSSSEDETETPSPTADPGLVNRVMPIQAFIMVSFIGILISSLYRIDYALENRRKNGAIRLQSTVDGTQGIFTVSTDFPKQKKVEEKDQVASWVIIPSLITLIKTGNIRQFLVRPRYSAVAMITLQATILAVPQICRMVDFYLRKNKVCQSHPFRMRDCVQLILFFSIGGSD